MFAVRARESLALRPLLLSSYSDSIREFASRGYLEDYRDSLPPCVPSSLRSELDSVRGCPFFDSCYYSSE
jgi:hypothetical protein